MSIQVDPAVLPPNPSSQRETLLWADLIRAGSIFLVVLGHVSAVPLVRLPVTDPSWNVANLYNVIARACVPMIFMVSGALLLTKQESIRDFYQKRLQRVFLPFLIWSILYWLAAREVPFDGPVIAVKTLLRDLMTKPAEYHLWFMYELFWLYLLTPVWRVLTAHASREVLWYFMVTWFIFGPLQTELEFRLEVRFLSDLGFLTSYTGYFLLGYLLAKSSLTPRQIIVAGIAYLLAAAYTFWATYTSSLALGALDAYHQTLTNWNIAVLSVSGFLLLKALGDFVARRGMLWLQTGIQRLAPVTFGIYLIHIFVMRYIGRPIIPLPHGYWKLPPRLSLSPLNEPSVFYIPAVTLAIFFVSWLVIVLLRKIPYLRAIT